MASETDFCPHHIYMTSVLGGSFVIRILEHKDSVSQSMKTRLGKVSILSAFYR